MGGTSALLSAVGVDIIGVAVTDGENSHPGRQAELRQRRPSESLAAAACLGLAPRQTVRLGHADGQLAEHRLTAELSELLRPGDLVLAPWLRDGHPDHDRAVRASRVAAERRHAQIMFYLVWAWHWASPRSDLPWTKAVRVELGLQLTDRKRPVVQCFTTQLAGPDPILPGTALQRLTRPYEVLLRS